MRSFDLARDHVPNVENEFHIRRYRGQLLILSSSAPESLADELIILYNHSFCFSISSNGTHAGEKRLCVAGDSHHGEGYARLAWAIGRFRHEETASRSGGNTQNQLLHGEGAGPPRGLLGVSGVSMSTGLTNRRVSVRSWGSDIRAILCCIHLVRSM